MSTQYRNGAWSEIEPLAEALETFQNAVEGNIAKKFVVGQDEDEVKEEQKTNEEKFEELRAQLEELQAKVDPTKAVKCPTFEQIQRFGKKEECYRYHI